MREATRRQVFGIGAGAIGVLAAPGSVAAVAESRPNDAKLLELEKRHEAIHEYMNTSLRGLDDDQSDRLRSAYLGRANAVLEEMQAITADSVEGLAAKVRATAYMRDPKGGLPLFERMEADVLDEVAALASKGA